MNHSELFDQFVRLSPEEKLLFTQKLIKIKPLTVTFDLDLTDPVIGCAILNAIADQIRRSGESLGK
jgi:hypothetical protein